MILGVYYAMYGTNKLRVTVCWGFAGVIAAKRRPQVDVTLLPMSPASQPRPRWLGPKAIASLENCGAPASCERPPTDAMDARTL